MKLKIITISIILLCTIAVVTHYNQKVNKKMLTNLSLANIEALASFDESTNQITKYFYNDQGRLIRTEKFKQSCCANGSLDCTNPLCEN